MPIYEFRCDECLSKLELQLKMSDPYPTLCPQCGKESLKKLMSLPAFQLKGSGWYKDAYDGKSNQKPEAKKSADDSGSSSVKDSASTATAPAASSSAPASAAAPASSTPSSSPAPTSTKPS
jgi:putative FmdB family regulatory protein